MTDTIRIPLTDDTPIILKPGPTVGSFVACVPKIISVAVPREIHNAWGKYESKKLMDNARKYAETHPEAVIQ